MELMRYFKILLKQRTVFYSCLCIFSLGYLAYCYLPPIVYRSVAKAMLIQKDLPAQFLGRSVPPGIDDYRSDSDASHDSWANTLVEVLENPQIAEDVIKRLDLKDGDGRPLRPSHLIIDYKFYIYLFLADRGVLLENPDQSRHFIITGYSTDREEALKIANAYAELFAARLSALYRTEINRAVPIMEKRKSDIETTLSDIEQQKHEYEKKENIVNIGTMITNLMTDRAGLKTLYETTIRGIDENRVSEEKTLALLREQPEFVESGTTEEYNSVIDTYKGTLATLENDMLKMKPYLTPEHPDSKGLSASIDEIRKKIAQEQIKRFGSVSKSRNDIYTSLLSKYINGKIDATIFDIRRDLIKNLIADYDRQLNDLNLKQKEINSFDRQLEGYRSAYLDLLQNLEQAKGVVRSDVSNLVTFQPAALTNTADDKFFPKRKLFAAVFVLAGFLGWLFAVFLMEYMEQGFSYPEEIEPHLGARLVETVPLYRKRYDMKALTDNEDFQRRIRNVISDLVLLDGTLPKSISVLSTNRHEGVTATAVSLSKAFAQSGKKVLLLDADSQGPGSADFFGVSFSRGILDVSAKPGAAAEVLLPSGIEGLMLGSIGRTSEPFSLAMRLDELQKAVASLGADFDVIIIDNPPVSVSHDGITLSRLAEAAVFVVAAESASIDAVKNALHGIKSMGGNVSGIVFNKLRK